MSPKEPLFRSSRKELAALLRRHFPLTRTLDVEVDEASPTAVRLSFPLEPSLNRQGTAFGGSLYAAAALAGWGLLWCVLREHRLADADIVIASSGERFLKPARDRFTAVCEAPRGSFDVALGTLRRKDRARADVACEVFCRNEACLVFRGTYGILRKIPGDIVAETDAEANLLSRFDV